ncbi:hypothetical protein D3C79_620420 [compost metagenome]
MRRCRHRASHRPGQDRQIASADENQRQLAQGNIRLGLAVDIAPISNVQHPLIEIQIARRQCHVHRGKCHRHRQAFEWHHYHHRDQGRAELHQAFCSLRPALLILFLGSEDRAIEVAFDHLQISRKQLWHDLTTAKGQLRLIKSHIGQPERALGDNGGALDHAVVKIRQMRADEPLQGNRGIVGHPRIYTASGQ